MANQPDNQPATLLAELYRIDPTLKEFGADLPRLIASLENNRPAVAIDETFVRELRASLLTYKPAVAPVVAPATPALFWWLTRLAPVGLSVVLLLVLLPDGVNAPAEPTPLNQPAPDMYKTAPAAPETMNSEMRMEMFMDEGTSEAGMADDTSMLMQAASSPSLEVAPPPAGTTLTVTSLTLEDTAWLVVHEDQGGALGAVLHSSLLEASTYEALSLELTRNLAYPELVTVVVYTANNAEQFSVANETIQIDPRTEAFMMVTTPVMSDLELELVE